MKWLRDLLGITDLRRDHLSMMKTISGRLDYVSKQVSEYNTSLKEISSKTTDKKECLESSTKKEATKIKVKSTKKLNTND